MYDLGKSGGDKEPTGKLTILAQHKEDAYKTESKEIKKVFFNAPVALKANFWYMVKVCITGPSSDAGGDGKESITGTDGVKFLFKDSKSANNGTTTKSGQLPGIIYRLSSEDDDDKNVAEVSDDKKDGSVVHMIKKDFAGTVSEVCVRLCVSVCVCVVGEG